MNLKGSDVMYLCRVLDLFLFYFILFMEPHAGTDVMMLRLMIISLIYFKFCNGVQNFILNMWQVVFANLFIWVRVFYGSNHIVPLPAYDLEVVHCGSWPVVF